MEPKLFPILRDDYKRGEKRQYIAWDKIQPFENHALRNHGQTLKRLAERGGLGFEEIYAVMHDIRLRDFSKIDETEAKAFVSTLIAE